MLFVLIPLLLDFCPDFSYTKPVVKTPSDNTNEEKTILLEELLEQERKRIGENLHLRAAQSLSHALFLLNLYEEENKKEDLEGARQAIKMAVNEIRYAIHELRNEKAWPLIPSIRDCITLFKEQTQIQVNFQAEGNDTNVTPEARHYVLTLAQEGLNNILKHSQATRCELLLTINDGGLSVIMKDNGTGFEENTVNEGAPHFGLKFLKERAEQMGGNLEIIFSHGKGTTLKSFVPIARKS